MKRRNFLILGLGVLVFMPIWTVCLAVYFAPNDTTEAVEIEEKSDETP